MLITLLITIVKIICTQCKKRLCLNMDKELEQLRKEWGVQKIVSPFVSAIEMERYYRIQKRIEEIEVKIRAKHYDKNKQTNYESRDSR